jgi:DNA-binding protein
MSDSTNIKKKGEKGRTDTNEIFIGNKPFMKYVIATVMQLKEDKNDSVIIKARGKFISRAVDVAEVAKKSVKEKDNLVLKDEIKINTEEFTNEENKKINISTIDIKLIKK